MKRVYVKENGNKVFAEVADEVESALTETRRAIWRNEAKERYYRGASLDAMTDKDKRVCGAASDPEEICIAAEERLEHRAKLAAALKSLTTRQAEVVKLLLKGKSVTGIAEFLGVTKQSVNDIRQAVQKKFKEFI